MNPEFNRVVIVGVGLIGGSLGMALCRRGLAREVVGTGSDPENLRLALELGAIHRFAVPPAGAVAGADLVIIATPVSITVPVLLEILPHLTEGTVVTDVGSTKGEVVREAERAVRPGISFVGGHPMSGSEVTGVRGADPYLFENAFYIITPTPRTPAAALDAVRKLAAGVGARVLEMDPEEHDWAVSAVSHLPHLVAAALVNTVARAPGSERALPLAAGGFRDTTRLASSSPSMWRDIFISNRRQVLKMLRHFKEELSLFEDMLLAGDGEKIQDWLACASQVRAGIPAKTRGYLPELHDLVLTVPDRPGAINGFTRHLLEAGINISDIAILRVREGEGGTIRVGLATREEQEKAVQLLREQGYTVFKR
ncbi:MAG: prephenate dehydrogenase [Peptococcaceae bacterium]|nr:prephenate dehydrogenase [Peptococcaceae bacterium]